MASRTIIFHHIAKMWADEYTLMRNLKWRGAGMSKNNHLLQFMFVQKLL